MEIQKVSFYFISLIRMNFRESHMLVFLKHITRVRQRNNIEGLQGRIFPTLLICWV